MASLLLSLYLLHLFDHGCISFSLDCTETPYMCDESNIRCLEDEDCFIACNEEQSCLSSTITCPTNGDCNIECDGWQACKDITIDSQHSQTGNLNILCSDSTDHCYGMRVLGSTVHTYDGALNLLCNGAMQSCMESEIVCPVTGQCLLSCNADMSCKYSNVTAPVKGDLSVNCNGEQSCLGTTFNGTHSRNMNVNGCIAADSCQDLVIYCPPHTNGSANCVVQGNDNMGSVDIYAQNGWADIAIDFSGAYDSSHGGTMHCGLSYEIVCEISSFEWRCSDTNDVCNSESAIQKWNERKPTQTSFAMQTLPDLSDNFEHGSMGMVLIAGGLVSVAIGCILWGVFRHLIHKMRVRVRAGTPKGYEGPNKSIVSAQPQIEAIIKGEEPSYEDSRGVIHHQHSNHERKMSSLHDKPKYYVSKR